MGSTCLIIMGPKRKARGMSLKINAEFCTNTSNLYINLHLDRSTMPPIHPQLDKPNRKHMQAEKLSINCPIGKHLTLDN